MSDNKKHSHRKILTVILLLIFVGAGIFYFSMNLDESEFAEPMNEEELELLEDDVEDGLEDDIEDDIQYDTEDIDDETSSSDQDDHTDSDDLTDPDDLSDSDDPGDSDDLTETDVPIDPDEPTTSDDPIDPDEPTTSDDPTDPDETSAQIGDQDTTEDEIDDIDQTDPEDTDLPDIETTDDETQAELETEDSITDEPDETEDEEPLDPERPDPIDEEQPETIAEEPEETKEDEGIIDRIISFLSSPFRSEDPEEIAIDDTDDQDEIDQITDESQDQEDSVFQLESKNLVVLGIDNLSEEQEHTFDFIGLISFDAPNLEVEFKIIPSRHTYEDQELRALSQEEITAIITELTGLQIDYELILDYSGFQYYVDEIDGIELELSTNFIVPDLDLELTQGNNQLDGSEALNYARYYNPDNGEISRINRQQEVIDKIYHKSLRLENILRLPGHYNHLINEKEAVKTDIDQEMIRNTIRYIRQLDQLSIKYSIFND